MKWSSPAGPPLPFAWCAAAAVKAHTAHLCCCQDDLGGAPCVCIRLQALHFACLAQVAESFPWTAGRSVLAHTSAVHTSVLGMRGLASAAGAAVCSVSVEESPDGCGWVRPLSRTCPAAAPSATGAPSPTDAAIPATAAAPEPQLGAALDSEVCHATCAGASCLGQAVGGGSSQDSGPFSLLVLPAECNLTGDRWASLPYLVRHVQSHGLGCPPHVRPSHGDGGGAGPPDGPLPRTAVGPRSSEGAGAVVPREGVPSGTTAWAAQALADGCSEAGRSGGGGRWLVLLDAAKACSTAPPDFATTPAGERSAGQACGAAIRTLGHSARPYRARRAPT
jgi:hypothetical protein